MVIYMNEEERFKITSNDYADIIVEYSGDVSLLTKFPDSSYNIIDRRYAVVHIPVIEMTPNSIDKFGYFAIPRCYGLLSSPSLDASGVNRVRNIPNLNLQGQGVLIGFVDTGIDYTNPVFKREDNTTKIISIWDQTIESDNYPDDFYYGTTYTREQINLAIGSEDPYMIVPTMDQIGHGTMLAGIAAGSEYPQEGFMGVAPNAEIVAVKLKRAKPYLQEFFQIPKDAICYQNTDIMFGVKYLLHVAQNLRRPIVICIGLGCNLADYGSGVLSNFLSFYSETVGTVIVTAAGNEGNRGHHYYGEITPPSSFNNIDINVSNATKGFSMELFGYTPSELWIDVFAPSGEFVTRIAKPIENQVTKQFRYQNTVVFIDNRLSVDTGEQLVLLRFFNVVPGIWRLLVYERIDLKTNFHVYLPMEQFISPDTYFFNSDTYTTLTAPGSSVKPLTVTAYNYINDSLYYNASRGFTAFNIPKPDIAAPGVNVLCPTANKAFMKTSGTSIAAAHTAGVAAMLLELGIVRGYLRTMNTASVKRLLIQGAKRDFNLTYPNADWGYGILDIFTTYDLFREELDLPSSVIQSCPEYYER